MYLHLYTSILMSKYFFKHISMLCIHTIVHKEWDSSYFSIYEFILLLFRNASDLFNFSISVLCVLLSLFATRREVKHKITVLIEFPVCHFADKRMKRIVYVSCGV